ncbi:MAG: BREX-1 system phosphatase PglZ type A [Prevotella sp.]|nr:BREX-1 system phosphatase PglZ type A [Prevotella sp.]
MTDSTKEKIQSVISDLIDRKRLVFWYDEGGQMQEFATSLQMPGVVILTLKNNAFTIKYKILKGEQPECGFLIYSPQSQPDDKNNWLLDLQMEAIPFSADMGSLYAAECGIPMELKQKVVDKHAAFFKTAGNKNKLASRLRQGMDADVIERQMLAVVCRTEPHYDQLTFALAKEAIEGKQEMLDKMEQYNLSNIYWTEIETMFGYTKQRNIKDLIIVLFMDNVNRHFGHGTLTNEASIFMHDWRDSRQYGDIYKEWAIQLESELGIKQILQEHRIEDLIAIETFPCVDMVIAQYLQMEVVNGTMGVDKIESIVDERENLLFYGVAEHTLKALLEARRTLEDIDQKMNGLIINSPEEGFGLYVNELYSIDLNYRHYIREASKAECKPEFLSKITEMVQRAYTNSYLMQLANKWQPIVDDMDNWKIDRYIPQRCFYDFHVSPYVQKKKKLFVIISDALRYETMVELQQRINRMSRMESTMKNPMLSTQPSYTQLGMAALLPNRELSYEKNADVVFADGQSTQGTDARKKVLCNRVINSLAIRSDDFLTITSPKTYFKDFDLIYIYSNVIDKAGDNKDTESNVFKATEDEFDNIVKIVELIRNGNGSNILITADHGYLYQNEQLDESDFTDFKVMGNVITDTRRFVIGSNLQPSPAVKTWNSEDVGLKAGLQVQTAKGMNRIRKQGSGSRFVHGGSMLQEVVVPVLHVNIKKVADVSQVDVDILNKRTKLTTNNQTISFFQTEAVTEKVKEITLRIGFYDAEGNLISDSFTTTFASESNDTTQREQKHSFMFRNQLSKLNGQEVMLRIERSIPNSNQFAKYKEFSYRVSVMFQAEF